jgi:CHAD domain-containing protein
MPASNAASTYAVDDGFELPSLTTLVAGADLSPAVPLSDGVAAEQRVDAVYFDTPDLRLAAAGLTVYRSTGGDDSGWHLRLPAGKGADGVRLPPGRVPPGRTPRTVPDRLQSMVWARTHGRPLQPVARATTERTLRRLTDPTGHVLLQVADERVTGQRLSTLDGSGEVASAPVRWRQLEVGGAESTAGLPEAVDTHLRDLGLRATATPTLARLLDGGRPRLRTGKRKDPRLTQKSPAGEVLLAHLREQVDQVHAQDLPVRLDAPDAVHKMRVATRRLRSALRTFGPLVDPGIARPLRDELKWLAAELGAARDAEVMRDRVRAAVAEEHPDLPVRAGADAALAELDQVYRAAHDRVVAELDGDRYHRILLTLCRLVEQPPLRKKAGRAAGTVLPGLVAASYDRVRKLVEKAGALPAGADRDEVLHDARKGAKEARYAGESVAAVFGDDAPAFAAAMEGVQAALGEHQDSVLTRERLHELALRASSPEVAFLYGRLHAREEQRAGRLQQRFDAAWQASARKRIHRWLR